MRTITIALITCGSAAVLTFAPHPWEPLAPTSPDPLAQATAIYPAGTVYLQPFGREDELWSMSDDGHAKCLPDGVHGEPSRHLHRGGRWFLATQELPGETYPDGTPRREIFLLEEGKRAVQLTNQRDLQPCLSAVRWPLHQHDQQISWIARRWSPEHAIVEGGIYTALLSINDAGQVNGLIEQPRAPLLASDLVSAGVTPESARMAVPNVCSFDFSPDGTELVWESLQQELYVAELVTGAKRLLTSRRGSDPAWSPDGAAIAFKLVDSFGPIVMMGPDGSSLEQQIPAGSGQWVVTRPVFSPDGEDLAHTRAQRLGDMMGADLLIAAWTFNRAGDGQCDSVLASSRGFIAVAWRDNAEAEMLSW